MVSFFIFLFLFLNVLGFSILGSIGVLVFVYLLLVFVDKSNETIALREFVLVLYALNYLFSPALMYVGLEKFQYYGMKMDETEYFLFALPSIFLLHKGIYVYKTNLFSPNLRMFKMNASVHEADLKVWTIGGTILAFIAVFFPSELAFFLYLISTIRFVGAFGMLVLDPFKFKWHIGGVFLYEMVRALRVGMFHDFLMWVLFAFLLAAYVFKPSLKQKVTTIVLIGLAGFILQLTKGEYRSRLDEDSNGISVFVQSVTSVAAKNKEGFFSTNNIASSLTRVNQAWIFASTVDNIEQSKDYQGFGLLYTYFEAALLPRIIAPNKLSAGDKSLFNRFSGKKISESTSMGLGVMADGFISFGKWGVYIFIFIFGLVFSLIFKVVDYWANNCLLFSFFLLPLLNYPVRPDCATSTILGHIVKGVIVFQGIVVYYNWYGKDKIEYVKSVAFKRGIPTFDAIDH